VIKTQTTAAQCSQWTKSPKKHSLGVYF